MLYTYAIRSISENTGNFVRTFMNMMMPRIYNAVSGSELFNYKLTSGKTVSVHQTDNIRFKFGNVSHRHLHCT